MFIYKITNTINSKIYIGQTSGSVSKRFEEHCRKSSTCRKLSYAIQKHGKENFKIEEIGGANSLSELGYLEWIKIHTNNSIHPNGYNLKEGGKVNSPCEETREKISKTLGGERFRAYEITKDNGNKCPGRYRVFSVDYLGEFYNQTRFCKTHGIDRRNSYDCLKGKVNRVGKFILISSKNPVSIEERIKDINKTSWENDNPYFEAYKIIEDNGKTAKSGKYEIFKVEFFGKYNSISECSRVVFKNNNSQNGIRRCLSGKYKQCKGFIFRYVVNDKLKWYNGVRRLNYVI